MPPLPPGSAAACLYLASLCETIGGGEKERDDLAVDRSRERFLFSFNPGGWLRKRG